MRELIEPTTFIDWMVAPGTWMVGDVSPALAFAIARSLGVEAIVATLDGTQILLNDQHGPIEPFADPTICNVMKDPEVGVQWFPLVDQAPTPRSLRELMDETMYSNYRLELAIDRVLSNRNIPSPATRQDRGFHGWRSCPAGEEPYWVTRVREARKKRLELYGDGRAQLHLVWSDGSTFSPMIDAIELRLVQTWFDDRLEPKPRATALSPSTTPRHEPLPGDVDEWGKLVLLGRLVTGTFALRGKRATITMKVAIPLPTTNWDQFFGAVLLAPSLAEARVFVEDIAAWLEVDMPQPTGMGVEVSFNWLSRKLTFNSDDHSHAEVYLNLHAGGTADDVFAGFGWPRPITLGEKDSGDREDLVRLLIETLATHCPDGLARIT